MSGQTPPISSGDPGVPGQTGTPEPIPEAIEIIDDLRQRLSAEREISLNAVDAVLGAQAEAAQVRAENKELQYRLHVREVELDQAKELLTIDPTGGDPADEERLGGERAPEIATAARTLVRAARHTVRRT